MRATTLRAAAALVLGTSLAVVVPGAANTSSAAPRWAPPTGRRSRRACRCTPREPSAPRTSSSPIAATTSTWATPRTAPARASRPTPTAATRRRSRCAIPVRFATNGSVVDAGETVGRGRLVYSSWRTMRARNTRTATPPATSTTSPWCASTATTEGRSIRACPSGEGPPASARVRSRPVTGSTATATRRCVGGAEGFGPKSGTIVEEHPSGWSHTVYTADPRHPRRLRKRLRRRPRSGVRHALDGRHRAPGGLQRGRRPGPPVEFAQRLSGIRGLRLAQGTQEFVPALG